MRCCELVPLHRQAIACAAFFEATAAVVCRRREGLLAVAHYDVNARLANEINCRLRVSAVSNDISRADHMRWIKAKTLCNSNHRTCCLEIAIAPTEYQKRLCRLDLHVESINRAQRTANKHSAFTVM